MHSRSVGPLLESVLEKRWLAYAITTSLLPWFYVSTAPATIELVSVCSVNGRFQSGNVTTVCGAKLFLRLENAPSCSTVRGMGNFRVRFVAKSLLGRMLVRGYAIIPGFHHWIPRATPTSAPCPYRTFWQATEGQFAGLAASVPSRSISL